MSGHKHRDESRRTPAMASAAATATAAAFRRGWLPLPLPLLLPLLLLLLQAATASGQRFGRPQQQQPAGDPYYYPQGQMPFPQEPPFPRPGQQGPVRRPGPGLSAPRQGFPSFAAAADGGLGAPCDYDEDCYSMEHTFCRAQQSCECKHGFVASAAGDRCLATVGARCNTKYDCSGLGPAGDCIQNVCDCGDGYVPAPDGTCLRGAQKLEEECLEQLQCQTLGDGTVCADGRCSCGVGRHANRNRDRCLTTRVLRESCTEDAECFIGVEYQGIVQCSKATGACQCIENYFDVDGKCTSGANSIHTVLSSVFLVLLVAVFNS